MVNTVTNKVARMLGKDETVRFLNLSLYQGVPIKQGITTIVRSSSAAWKGATADHTLDRLWLLRTTRY